MNKLEKFMFIVLLIMLTIWCLLIFRIIIKKIDLYFNNYICSDIFGNEFEGKHLKKEESGYYAENQNGEIIKIVKFSKIGE